MKYKDYIDGDDWHTKSSNYLENHEVCELCHKHEAIEVHHTSYKRIGQETEDDLMALCVRCHYGIHSIPPLIDDEAQLNKALKIMKYFTKYPVIKTLVLNEISERYYNCEYMLDVAANECDETAFFAQNLMEMFYKDGKELGVDMIEETYALCVKFKIQASKNKIKKQKRSVDLTKKYESGEINYIDVSHTTTMKIDQSLKEIVETKIKNFCLKELQDRKVLAYAKSYMNLNYYGGRIYFNREGIITAAQFYLKIKEDNLQKELFSVLNGKIENIMENKDV